MLYRQSQPVVVWCWMAVHRICYKVIIRTITDIAAPNPSQFTDYCHLWGTERKWQVLVPSVGCSVQTNDICNLLRSQSYPEYYNCMVSSNHGYKKKAWKYSMTQNWRALGYLRCARKGCAVKRTHKTKNGQTTTHTWVIYIHLQLHGNSVTVVACWTFLFPLTFIPLL